MRTATLTAKVNRWLHEHLAMKTPAKLLGGLALGALVMAATALPLGTTYADEPARPLSSEQIQCYPEDVVLGWCYGFAATPDPALAAGTSVSGVQFEEWPEAGFDSYTYHRFMVEQGKLGKGLSGEQAATVIYRYDRSLDDEFMSDAPFFHALNQGKVANPSAIDLNEVWTEIEDTPVYHLMKQLKVGSPRVTKQTECYPELDIC